MSGWVAVLIGALAGLTALLLIAERFRETAQQQDRLIELDEEQRPPAVVIPMFADRQHRS